MEQQATQYTPAFQQQFDVGAEHIRARRWVEAESVNRAILKDWPQAPNAHYHLGIALNYQGKFEEALAAFRAAVALQPNFSEALNGLGNTLIQTQRLAEAAEAYSRVVALRESYPPAWNNLANALKDLGQLDRALTCYDRVMLLKPEGADALSNRLCTIHYHPAYDAPAIFREARRWNERFARPVSGEILPHDNDPSPQRRLRIGYVSRDLRRHCIAMLIDPLLAHHNHDRFEIFCYSNVTAPDLVTARLKYYADAWRDIANLTDQAAAQLIREDKIDILVDLNLHSAGVRLGVFARKPAPIQVTWLGYPGTTGLDAIDYRLTDPRLDPPDTSDSEIRNPKSEIRTNDPNSNDPKSNHRQNLQDLHEPLSHLEIGALGVDSSRRAGIGFRISDFSTKEPYYSERSIRLPDTFWCYDPRALEETETAAMPAPNPLPALTAGHVTFGCLNNFCKVTDPTLALWARVMAAVPGSHLILLVPPGPQREGLVQKLGIPAGEADRVRFVPLQPRGQYLETYHQIDLCLDTIPYNGHTTTLDASWMGVPTVTRVGSTVVGRAGWSQLHNLGLTDLVARTDEEFVQKAVDWAGDLQRLGELRAALRPRMEQSPLMDGSRFALNVENVYRQVWQAWCATRQGA